MEKFSDPKYKKEILNLCDITPYSIVINKIIVDIKEYYKDALTDDIRKAIKTFIYDLQKTITFSHKCKEFVYKILPAGCDANLLKMSDEEKIFIDKKMLELS